MEIIQSIKKTLRKRTAERQASPQDLLGEEIQKADKQAQGRKQPELEMTISCLDDQQAAALDLKDEEMKQLKHMLYQKDMEIQRLRKIIESDKEEISRQAVIIRSANDAYNDLRRAFTAAEHCFVPYLNDEMPKRILHKKFGEEDIIGPTPSLVNEYLEISIVFLKVFGVIYPDHDHQSNFLRLT